MNSFLAEHKAAAAAWASAILETPDDYLILDTETTCLVGEIVEIAVTDLQGNELFNQRVRPLHYEISRRAQEVHGISIEMLKDCPTWPDIYGRLKSVIENRNIIIYNAQFDTARLQTMYSLYEMEPIEIEPHCAMLEYARWYGEWNSYRGNFKWQRLQGGDHSALGDCRATLRYLKKMAADLAIETNAE